jgi:hypothetical protein
MPSSGSTATSRSAGCFGKYAVIAQRNYKFHDFSCKKLDPAAFTCILVAILGKTRLFHFRRIFMRGPAFVIALLISSFLVVAAQAAIEDTFIIRNSTGSGDPPVIQTNNDYVTGATEFVISQGGQKAAWGTDALDGQKVGQIVQLAITRYDDRTRFTAGTGPYVAPYFNIWITDGLGNFAVIANEPSNAAFQSLYSNGYDLDWNDISGKVAKVYENADTSWLPNSGVGLTFADVANFTIQAPTVSDLTTGWLGLGSGAPRELGTNLAYGFNWIFGDTLSNYVADVDDEGYVVDGFAARGAVPEPLTLLTWGGLVGCAVMGARRYRQP